MSRNFQIKPYRGCLAVQCTELLQDFVSLCDYIPETAKFAKDTRDGPRAYHITIATPAELSVIGDKIDVTNLPIISDIVILGLGYVQHNCSESWSAIVMCPSLQKFRVDLGLPEKDFHITLGFHGSDLHAPSSSYLIQSIRKWVADANLAMRWKNEMGSSQTMHFLLNECSSSSYPLLRMQLQAAMERLFHFFTTNSCDSASLDSLKEIGKISVALNFSVLQCDVGWFLLRAGYLLGLRLILSSMVHQHRRIDMSQLKPAFPIDFSATVSSMTQEKLYKNIVELNKIVLAHSHQPLDKFFVFVQKDHSSLTLVSLPRNFSWVGVPNDKESTIERFLMAGCAYPGNIDHMLAIYFVGIKHVITVHEGALSPQLQIDSAAIGKKGRKGPSTDFPLLNFTHISCNDRTPPSRRQVQDDVIPIMHRHISCKEGVLVHCLGGLGRTNTLIIAYLMFCKQISAALATEEVTRQRRIILSESQKEFLREWYKVVMSGFYAASSTVSNVADALGTAPIVAKVATSVPVCSVAFLPPVPSVSHKEFLKLAQVLKIPPVIILCGLPASGKSTFAKALVAAQSKFFIRVNRDEMRGKGEVDRALSDALRPCLKLMNQGGNRKPIAMSQCIVIDNCHVTATKRREWMDAVHRLPTWCVYFDRPVEVCKQRISQRKDHPTIPAGPAGLPIIDSMLRQWQTPTVEEGFLQVHRIQSDEEMYQLLSSWRIPFDLSAFATVAEVPAEVDSAPSGSEEEEEEDCMAGTAADAFNGDKPIKFPRTAHALNLGAATRDDKILPASDLQNWISQRKHLIIEEKIDGANLGFHIRGADNRIIAQNRSHYISSAYHPQFALLDKWIAKHTEDLWEILEPDRHILYGEWMYATHSVYYDALPDHFIAYDLYDTATKTFLPRHELTRRLSSTKIFQVPVIYEGIVESQDHLRSLVHGESQYGATRREGIVIRLCDDEKVTARAKLVRSDFIAGNERWNRSSKLQTNELRKLVEYV